MNITFHHNYHVEKLKEMMKFEKRISFIFWSPVLLTFSFLPSYVFFLIFSYFIAKNAHYFSENIIKIMNILFQIHPFFNILYDTTVFLCIMIPFSPLLKYLINEVTKNVWGFIIFQCKIRVYLEKKKKNRNGCPRSLSRSINRTEKRSREATFTWWRSSTFPRPWGGFSINERREGDVSLRLVHDNSPKGILKSALRLSSKQ